jgi:hypothetical protein
MACSAVQGKRIGPDTNLASEDAAVGPRRFPIFHAVSRPLGHPRGSWARRASDSQAICVRPAASSPAACRLLTLPVPVIKYVTRSPAARRPRPKTTE